MPSSPPKRQRLLAGLVCLSRASFVLIFTAYSAAIPLLTPEWGMSAMIFALFAGSFFSGALLYGLTGLFSGGSYTPGLTLIAERVAATQRGRAMGFYLAAASFGYAVALMLTGAAHASPAWSRGLAWSAIGAGALLGPLAALRLRRMPESAQMADGKR